MTTTDEPFVLDADQHRMMAAGHLAEFEDRPLGSWSNLWRDRLLAAQAHAALALAVDAAPEVTILAAETAECEHWRGDVHHHHGPSPAWTGAHVAAAHLIDLRGALDARIANHQEHRQPAAAGLDRHAWGEWCGFEKGLDEAIQLVARHLEVLERDRDSIARDADPEPQPDAATELLETELRLEQFVTALRLTVEYVGLKTLPPVDGWSWFEALKGEPWFDEWLRGMVHVGSSTVGAGDDLPTSAAMHKRIGYVESAGGGVVRVIVDRNLDTYPEGGATVFVIDREPPRPLIDRTLERPRPDRTLDATRDLPGPGDPLYDQVHASVSTPIVTPGEQMPLDEWLAKATAAAAEAGILPPGHRFEISTEPLLRAAELVDQPIDFEKAAGDARIVETFRIVAKIRELLDAEDANTHPLADLLGGQEFYLRVIRVCDGGDAYHGQGPFSIDDVIYLAAYAVGQCESGTTPFEVGERVLFTHYTGKPPEHEPTPAVNGAGDEPF